MRAILTDSYHIRQKVKDKNILKVETLMNGIEEVITINYIIFKFRIST